MLYDHLICQLERELARGKDTERNLIVKLASIGCEVDGLTAAIENGLTVAIERVKEYELSFERIPSTQDG